MSMSDSRKLGRSRLIPLSLETNVRELILLFCVRVASSLLCTCLNPRCSNTSRMPARDTTNKTPACSYEVSSIVSTRKESLGRLKTLNTPIAFKGNLWDLFGDYNTSHRSSFLFCFFNCSCCGYCGILKIGSDWKW